MLADLPPLLLPAPRHISVSTGRAAFPIRREQCRDDLSGEPWLTTTVTGAACGASPTRLQSYRLAIAERAMLTAPTPAGIRNGLATLAQLVRQYGGAIPHLTIEDEPVFTTRGVMLDVSRDRVPTMPELFRIADTLASFKINHLQLYTEHTFAYAGHKDVWRGWSPITPAEIRELDAHCRARGIELVANQNCFGHLAKWLALPGYAHLAETHGDWMFDTWPRRGPFSICPTDPASARFIEDLLSQLLPCFSAPLVNVGCDETYDIAYGRSKAECERRGRVTVYLDFVSKICDIARGLGKRPMFWADIALSRPESAKETPDDLIALAWSYEPFGPFAQWCDTYRSAGRDVWVCPGTSSWRSITGRTQERRGNIAAAAVQGAAHGAAGFLVCDWGDTGHHQQWPIALWGLVDGANAAWTGRGDFDATAASLHALGDESLRAGAWLHELGDADLPLREVCMPLSRAGVAGRIHNQSALFIDMLKGLDEQREVGPVRLWEEAGQRIADLDARKPTGLSRQLDGELSHTLRVAAFAAARGAGRRRGLNTSERSSLRKEVLGILDEHRRLWLARSREGGLEDSCGYYRQIADSFGDA